MLSYFGNKCLGKEEVSIVRFESFNSRKLVDLSILGSMIELGRGFSSRGDIALFGSTVSLVKEHLPTKNEKNSMKKQNKI